MLLEELLNLFDRNREGQLKVQICKTDIWDEYDTIYSDSPILEAIEHLYVKTAAAIEEDVIRIEIDWDGVND